MVKLARMSDEKFPIGTLAQRSGAHVETIRYYERIGLLPRPSRSSSGRRVYGPDDLRTLTFIRRARELGFKLEDIRTMLELGGPGAAKCRDVRVIAARHLEDVRAKLHDLRKLERTLAASVAQCSGGSAVHCAVLDMLDAASPGRVPPP
jgi:MerR family mercuric resistance operon transcriptional regulator